MKRIFLVALVTSLITLINNCEVPTAPPPDELNDPWMYAGEIEIMYVRVKEVVDPNAPDPGAATIFHYKYGGKNSTLFVSVGENKWIATAFLVADPQPYYIWVIDMKVTGTYRSIGEDFYLRLKKEGAEWVKLTCIGPNPHSFTSNEEAARFIFDNARIQNPVPCK